MPHNRLGHPSLNSKSGYIKVVDTFRFGIRLDIERAHLRAPISAVSLVWWRKQGDEYRATSRERQRSKFGRKARLQGGVVEIASTVALLDIGPNDVL